MESAPLDDVPSSETPSLLNQRSRRKNHARTCSKNTGAFLITSVSHHLHLYHRQLNSPSFKLIFGRSPPFYLETFWVAIPDVTPFNNLHYSRFVPHQDEICDPCAPGAGNFDVSIGRVMGSSIDQDHWMANLLER